MPIVDGVPVGILILFGVSLGLNLALGYALVSISLDKKDDKTQNDKI